MIDFIVDNYYLIIIIAAFLIFALIGFIVDTIKNKNREETIQNDDTSTSSDIINNQEQPINIPVEEPQTNKTAPTEKSVNEPSIENVENPNITIPEVEEEKDNK